MNVYDTNSSPMKTYKLLVLLLCFSLQLFAQDNTNSLLKGVIYDSNSQQPMMYASVFVLNSNAGIIRNEQNKNLELIHKMYFAQFYLVGFSTIVSCFPRVYA